MLHSDYNFKLVFVGKSNVGKTSMMVRITVSLISANFRMTNSKTLMFLQ